MNLKTLRSYEIKGLPNRYHVVWEVLVCYGEEENDANHCYNQKMFGK